ncbi:hypothetical protein HHL28_05950 [Aerophototrophica crusticola]|uniref:DUF3035 domain-containing protein n=1 Tax=Aerophototrophica crusticola TaxID=1709002 RepID=A0A858R5N1_9PROT|nr:hypothetical protein HHL28_05950 [Rhodospirillaceae bacterium B3]
MFFTLTRIKLRHHVRRLAAPAMALAALSVLPGCANVPLPDVVFDDGPATATPDQVASKDPQAALTGARPIRRADPGVDGYPNLSTVPPRPNEFSTPVERQALLDRLTADRGEGEAVAGNLRATDVPAPKAPVTTGLPAVPDAPPPVPQAAPRVP